MSPEELDVAIELLLEERPNEEKPKRRRRNKFKDLKKKVLRNEPIISDAMVFDLIGGKFESKIKTMEVQYEKTEVDVGMVEGWYSVINDIADQFDVQKKNIRLSKLYDYYSLNGEYKQAWSGLSHVLVSVYEMKLSFYDKDNKLIARRGTDWDSAHFEEKPIKEGLYDYDKDAKDFVNMYFSSVPNLTLPSKREVNDLKYSPERLLELDEEGKYKDYIVALREHPSANFWSETYRIERTKNNGTKQRLINELNSHGRGAQYMYGSIETYIEKSLANDEDDCYDLLDRAVAEYEDSHHKVVYEYVW